MEIKIDSARANTVLDKLMQRHAELGYPYNLKGVEPPQVEKNLPTNLTRKSREHALYLFCLCFWMRGGIESDTAARGLTQVYEEHPRYFLPEFVDDLRAEQLAECFRKNKLGFQAKEISRNWIRNFKRLRDEWWSDPVELFRYVATYEEVVARVKNNGKTGKNHRGFYGFQEKMVSMIIYFLMDADFLDPFDFPVPVDIHVLRILLSNELLVVRHAPDELNGNGLYSKQLLAAARKLVLGYCKRRREIQLPSVMRSGSCRAHSAVVNPATPLASFKKVLAEA